MTTEIPQAAYAVQLTGPDTLNLNKAKPVPEPGPHQILCKVEATGLCYSDLKLLKQFDTHARKIEVTSGVDPQVLEEIPSYVPGKKAGVPGHEAVVRVIKAGPETQHKVGERALIQADYRWLKTAVNNGAFGYNFEGALQEYVLIDERVSTSPDGESMQLVVQNDQLSTSAIGLIEPWACVEDAYVSAERRAVLPGGRLLVVVDAGHEAKGVAECLDSQGPPQETLVCGVAVEAVNVAGAASLTSLDNLGEQGFDDIIYFGADAATIEKLDRMLASAGILNIVQGGKKIGKEVNLSIGRTHYGLIRFTGTTGDDAAAGYQAIPVTPEIRDGDKILVIGAAGPMGVMHVIRLLCHGAKDVEIVATDFDDERLAALDEKANRLAVENNVRYRSLNPSKNDEKYEPSYVALMVPVAPLVADAVKTARPNGIINIFAGIPATVFQDIDLDAYIEKQLYFIGTSGSNMDDMRIVLKKVEAGSLDTNLSVAAVSGMEGAIPGIRAVEDRSIPGKIIVYPMLHNMGLVELEDLKDKYPTVYAKLDNGQWCKAAEEELLQVAD